MARLAGALPVPDAGKMLLPGSVDWFGRLVPLFTLALLGWGFATRTKATSGGAA